MMIFMVKTSLGILGLFVLVYADVEKSNIKLDEYCQALKCNPSTEICRLNSKCDIKNENDLSKCVYCALKNDLNGNSVSKTLLSSSIRKTDQPLAPRLVAKSNGNKISVDSISSTAITKTLSKNKTSNELNYDDYYEYDEDETLDKQNEFGEEDEYLDDYAESDSFIHQSEPIRKYGICPRLIDSTEKCDQSKIIQSDCRVDTDCPDDKKCCEAACGKRICNSPITTSVSVCPSTFTCTLNCRLGYKTDSNGCLLCECQSCPSMDQCTKNCPSGYLKDLFGCNICECSDQCPPFSCGINCPSDVGFAKSADGCPICQCASTKSEGRKHTSSCQDDVHCPPGFRCLNDERNVPMCQAVEELIQPPLPTEKCPNNLLTNCKIKCPDGNYVLDENGCPTCSCLSNKPIENIGRPPVPCPLIKCRANCGNVGYQLDENGCKTCHCATTNIENIQSKPRVECSRVMCRMFCQYGFRRDENGCEICQCNDSPQPCPKLNCDRTCSNGFRKDYSGCSTCQCECLPLKCSKNCTNGFEKDESGCLTCNCKDDQSKQIINNNCSPMTCDLNCKYGFERDLFGCQLCSCNRCPLYQCRMFCMYGFKKNSDGCDVCECDWTPVSENIRCDERIPCAGSRVCNLNLHLCELVSPDKVNWFLYNFDIKTKFFNDPAFVNIFKNGLINNIAMKYDLEPTQITVSSIEKDGLTSFQIMPFFIENLEDFQRKMDQIDNDLNAYQFQDVLPAIARSVEQNRKNPTDTKWSRYVRKNPRFALYLSAVLIGFIALIIAGIFLFIIGRRFRFPGRSESKSPIFDALYHPAPTEDDHYHAVHAPDGTAYVVVESDDVQSANNDRRALV